MTGKLDKENILTAIEDLYKNNLSNKIDEITTEKNDGVVLKYVAKEAYSNELNEKVQNYDPFLLINISEALPIDNRGRLGESITYSVIIVVEDPINQTVENYKRMLRYGRCLKEVAKDNWKNFFRGLELEIGSLQPISFSDMNTNKRFKAVGVNIKISFYN